MMGDVGADLPDASVGLPPAALDRIGERTHRPPCLRKETVPSLLEDPGGLEDPAVPVELVLIGSAVADTDRHAVGVARPAAEFAFGRRVAAVQGEQHGQARATESAGVQEPPQEVASLVDLA